MNKSQLALNTNVEGGILGALASLKARFLPVMAKRVLPALLVSVLSGLGHAESQSDSRCSLFKEIWYVCCLEIDGKCLYLGPVSGSRFESVSDGLYLGKEVKLYDGKVLYAWP